MSRTGQQCLAKKTLMDLGNVNGVARGNWRLKEKKEWVGLVVVGILEGPLPSVLDATAL